MIAPWAARYVGLPFQDGGRTREGLDCFGLVWIVYRDEFHIDLPPYQGAYTSAQERDEVAALLVSQIPADAWRPVTGMPLTGDAVVFRVLNQPWHCGIMVSPREFLHVEQAQGTACIERLDSWRWVRRRHGIFRHPRMT